MRTSARNMIRRTVLRIPRTHRRALCTLAAHMLEVKPVPRCEQDLRFFRILTGAPRGLAFFLPSDQTWMALSFSLRLNEPEVSASIESLCKPGAIALDLGASLGYHTLSLARLVGTKGQVYSFEPNPSAMRILRRTISYNGLRNVSLQQYAVADRVGQAAFCYESATDGLAHLRQVQRDVATSQSRKHTGLVDVVSLDHFVRQVGIAQVDLVKIDVEGAELLVLEGMQTILHQMHPSIICEFSSSGNAKHGMAFIERFGYSTTALDMTQHPRTGDVVFNVLAV